MESHIRDQNIRAIDHLQQILLTLEKQRTGDDNLPFIFGDADIETMKQTGIKSLYEAVRLHAYSTIE